MVQAANFPVRPERRPQAEVEGHGSQPLCQAPFDYALRAPLRTNGDDFVSFAHA
jgi:hypothetical protein